MRFAELVVGGLLVAASALGPVVEPSQGPGLGELVEGSAWFREATYSGSASVRASEALLLAEGPVATDFEATSVRLVVYDRHEVHVEHDGSQVSLGPQDERRWGYYEHATIHLAGREAGRVTAWPQADAGAFSLSLAPSQGTALYPSTATSPAYARGEQHEPLLRPPTFVLEHGEVDHRFSPGEPVVFTRLNATGGMAMMVTNATVTIDSAAGRETIWTGVRERERALSTATVETHTVAELHFEPRDLDLGFQGLQAAFLTHAPTWSINGTLAFSSERGTLGSQEERHDLTGAEVGLRGNTSLLLEGHGPDEETSVANATTLGVRDPSSSEPVVEAQIEGEANGTTVNGQALVTPPASTLSEEVTLLSKIVGALLIAWAIAKKHLVFLPRLLARDPLKNKRRQKLHSFLQAQGMAHVREIQRATGIPIGSLVYHLRVLRRAGYLASIRRAGYKVYFATSPDLTVENMRQLALLADPTRRNISEALVRSEPMSQGALAERLDLTLASISRQLSTLVDAGLVERQGARNSEYRPTPLLRQWVLDEA